MQELRLFLRYSALVTLLCATIACGNGDDEYASLVDGPSGLRVTQKVEFGQINLAWSAVDAASSYELYKSFRGEEVSGVAENPVTFASAVSESYRDTVSAAGSYFYEVAAIFDDKTKSKRSRPVTVIVKQKNLGKIVGSELAGSIINDSDFAWSVHKDRDGCVILAAHSTTQGADSTWLSTDDTVEFRELWFENSDLTTAYYSRYSSPGDDGGWGTADDEIQYSEEHSFQKQKPLKVSIYSSIGSDNQPLTDDDVLTTEYTFEYSNERISHIRKILYANGSTSLEREAIIEYNNSGHIISYVEYKYQSESVYTEAGYSFEYALDLDGDNTRNVDQTIVHPGDDNAATPITLDNSGTEGIIFESTRSIERTAFVSKFIGNDNTWHTSDDILFAVGSFENSSDTQSHIYYGSSSSQFKANDKEIDVARRVTLVNNNWSKVENFDFGNSLVFNLQDQVPQQTYVRTGAGDFPMPVYEFGETATADVVTNSEAVERATWYETNNQCEITTWRLPLPSITEIDELQVLDPLEFEKPDNLKTHFIAGKLL